MLLTILTFTFAMAPVTAPNAVLRTPVQQGAVTPGKCLNIKAQEAKDRPPLSVNNLAELPPGDLHLAVARRIDGCQVPTIIKYGIGGSGR